MLEYLGKADAFLKRLKGKDYKKKIKSYSHGAVYALLKVSKGIGMLDILRKYLPSQKRDKLDVAQSLLLSAIYRASSPGSKRAFCNWVKTTTLPRLMKFPADKITSQHFWDQMNKVTEKHIEKIEDEIASLIIEKYKLGLSALFYDTTNFFTYIDTKNTRTDIAQRGHNKQKRNDLRQFNLALLTTKEFLLPLISHVYEGNRNDVGIFPEYLKMMLKRLKKIVPRLEDITLVFDKGNNSSKGMNLLKGESIGYVGSISIYSHGDLIAISDEKYHKVELSGREKVLVYRTEKELWGDEHVVLIKKSEKLKEGQIRGLNRDVSRKLCLLRELKEKLSSARAKKRNKGKLEKQVDKILRGQFIKDIIEVKIKKAPMRRSKFDIEYKEDTYVKQGIIDKIFGKKVFITNRKDWTDKEIIEAYHGQSKIEKIFRHFKNPYHCAVRPQFHWTDQKIKVHVFSCLLGLLLAEILRKKVFDAGIDMSLEEILDRLENIRESTIISYTGERGKPIVTTQLEEMDETEEKLFEIVEQNSF